MRFAHKFAQYVLILHCPWDTITSPPVANWKEFKLYVNRLRTTGTLICITRLHWIGILANGLPPKDNDKLAVMSYRACLSEVWACTRKPAERFFHRSMRTHNGNGRDEEDDGDITAERRERAENAIGKMVADVASNDPATLAKQEKNMAFCNSSTCALRAMLGAAQTPAIPVADDGGDSGNGAPLHGTVVFPTLR